MRHGSPERCVAEAHKWDSISCGDETRIAWELRCAGAQKKRREAQDRSWCPSEFSVTPAVARASLATTSRNSLLAQSTGPAEVPHLLVMRSHFAVGHFLGLVVFLQGAVPITLSNRLHPLTEFCVPPETKPTRPSQPAEAGRLLSWASAPFSTSGLGDPLLRALPRPATVRLQGLATLLAAFARRVPAGFVSHRRRSWDSPFGAFSSRKVSAAFANGWTRVPFSLPVFPSRRIGMGRPCRPRFPGFDPFRSPSRSTGD